MYWYEWYGYVGDKYYKWGIIDFEILRIVWVNFKSLFDKRNNCYIYGVDYIFFEWFCNVFVFDGFKEMFLFFFELFFCCEFGFSRFYGGRFFGIYWCLL